MTVQLLRSMHPRRLHELRLRSHGPHFLESLLHHQQVVHELRQEPYLVIDDLAFPITIVAFLAFHEVGYPNDAGSSFVNAGNAYHERVYDIAEIVRSRFALDEHLGLH
jgi:hypothetical protein